MELDLAKIRERRRPLWMTHFGVDSVADMLGGGGDIWTDRLFPEWTRQYGEEFSPTFDFYEEGGKFHLSMELPGCSKDDLRVTVKERVLTISGRKESSTQQDVAEEGRNYFLKEVRSGSFSRTLNLPDDVDEDHVDATLKDGVLTVILPRKHAAEAKKIAVS